MTSINYEDLKEFVFSSFVAMGLNKLDSEIFSDALMFSELCVSFSDSSRSFLIFDDKRISLATDVSVPT